MAHPDEMVPNTDDDDDFTPEALANLGISKGPVFVTAENLDRALTRIAELEKDNARLREALDSIAEGDGCYTYGYDSCCDFRCRDLAREALAVPSPSEEPKT